MKKTLNFVSCAVILVAALVFVGIGIYQLCNPPTYDYEAQAEITSIETDGGTWVDGEFQETFSVFVKYEANGRTYEDVVLDSYSSSMKVGDVMTIQCNADSPYQAHMESGSLGPILFIVIGGLVAVADVVVFLRRKSK